LISINHEIKIEHSQKNTINKFLKNVWKDFTDFKNSDPMRCYLFEKRDIFTHNEYAGSMGATYTELPDGKKIFDNRFMESKVEASLEYSSCREIIDIGECNLSKTQRDTLIQQLTDDDMRQFLDKFLEDIKNFVITIERKYCL